MVESTFYPHDDLLVTTLRNNVTLGDLVKALSMYDDDDFRDTTDVVYDMRDVEIGFDASAMDSLNAMFGRRMRRGVGTKTAIVTNSKFVESVLKTAYEAKNLQTIWKFFDDLEGAIAWAKAPQ